MRNLVEKLAECVHISWSNWMKHVFHQTIPNPDGGGVIIPKQEVYRWKARIGTEYTDLSESDKDRYRTEAIRYIIEQNKDDGSFANNIQNIIVTNGYIVYRIAGDGDVCICPYSKKYTDNYTWINNLLQYPTVIGKFFDVLDDDDLSEIAREFINNQIDGDFIESIIYRGCIAKQKADYMVVIENTSSNAPFKKIYVEKTKVLSKDELEQLVDNIIIATDSLVI